MHRDPPFAEVAEGVSILKTGSCVRMRLPAYWGRRHSSNRLSSDDCLGGYRELETSKDSQVSQAEADRRAEADAQTDSNAHSEV